ncbi:MAG TPA: hypothetical protein VLZ05_25435 [Mycobacterium sp.]|nr:hypothetical protein [Mycobacterium sp.]
MFFAPPATQCSTAPTTPPEPMSSAEIGRIQTGGARTVKEQGAAKRDSVNKPVVPTHTIVSGETPDDLAFEPAADESHIGKEASMPRRRPARRIGDEDGE